MKLKGTIIEARFRKRCNRFLALVEIAGTTYPVHVPTSGRMEELLIPGNTVFVQEVHGPRRKSFFELIMTLNGNMLVSIDSRLPNTLMLDALIKGEIEEFRAYHVIDAEYTWNNSRLDFLLSDGIRQCLIEVKSVTLVVNGVGLFPDAPTLRGTKHVQDLIRARQEGIESAVVFVIQRNDVLSFSTNLSTDPDFADTLHKACDNGVQIIAYKCQVDVQSVSLTDRVPVILGNKPMHTIRH